MEEEGLKEGTRAEDLDLVISHQTLLPGEQFTWLLVTDGEYDCERHIFCSMVEDHYYIRFVPELENKYVACCYGGLLVLMDKSTEDCSILNILTMEKSQLPPLRIHSHHINTECVMSSPRIDGNCRFIFFNRTLRKLWFCGDSEFIERESMCSDDYWIDQLINFKGKLYALTDDFNLFASDFSDLDLHLRQVVSGNSLIKEIFTNNFDMQICLVESCEELLLILIGNYDYEVSDVRIFKADFTIGNWVKVETLGDRAIFLAPHIYSFSSPHRNSFSSPAKAVGIKGNAIYWVKTSFGSSPPERHLYMYDIKDKSISMSLSFPIVGTFSSLSLYGVSFPMTCNEVNKPKQDDKSPFYVQSGKATLESTELQIEQRKYQKREKAETIARTENFWADLPNDLLLEIFSHLCAGETVAFRSVCRSWYSLSPPSRNTQQFVLPLKSSDYPSPLLMCPDNKAKNPIHGELYNIDFTDIPGARATWDGWLLMDYESLCLFFYNPLTRAEINLPKINARSFLSFCFFGAPTSADFSVVIAAMEFDLNFTIYFKMFGDEDWSFREISQEKESFRFSACNPVFYNGLYYFLGYYAKLLIFNPENDEVRVIEAPKFISELRTKGGHQYMAESDGKLIAVFVGPDGSSVYTCEWNIFTSEWKVLRSLGNIMLFVSRTLSICKRATVSGTGNKIYFPRVIGDEGQILFYSLATKRYHTFEMGTSYPNFLASKFYPLHNGWFLP